MHDRSDSYDLPASLQAELQAAAAQEHRPAGELLCDAVEQFLAERRRFSRHDAHSKIARGLESLSQGKGLDGESVMADLLAELDALQPAQ
jgi:predicted transcriptional regulator